VRRVDDGNGRADRDLGSRRNCTAAAGADAISQKLRDLAARESARKTYVRALRGGMYVAATPSASPRERAPEPGCDRCPAFGRLNSRARRRHARFPAKEARRSVGSTTAMTFVARRGPIWL
jgi:hypothetical protein